jgi:DNA-binding PadR family transcriptional regulator
MPARRAALGDVEHFVLIALLHLDGESYSVRIMDEIRRRTGREVAKAAVYIALRRLEEKRLLVSHLGEATPERGGRAKRYFKLTKAGAKQLKDARQAFVQMWAGAEHLVQRAQSNFELRSSNFESNKAPAARLRALRAAR